MGSLTLKLISFFLSLLIFIGVSTFFISYFHRENTQKIAIKGEKIEVFIEQKEAKKPVVKPAASKPKPKQTHSKKPKGSSSAKRSSAKELRSLFSSLNAKRYTTKKTTYQAPKNRPSRLKGSRAQELLKKLDLKNPQIEASKKMIKAVEGERDPYLQKVYKILYENWIPSKLSAGSFARVRISIDQDGNLRYQILQLSNNEVFNQEFRSYLRYIQSLKFPPPDQPKSFVVKFEAKE